MNKREKKAFIIVLLLLVFSIGIILFVQNENNKSNIKLSDIEVTNEDKLLLSKTERDKCLEDLINYLNAEQFYKCEEIRFYNNQDDVNNKTYFYALVIGADESLIEITNLGNGNFKYSYIANELTPEAVSEDTGVSYKQIVNYDEYKKDKELEDIRENAKSALPDDTEMP